MLSQQMIACNSCVVKVSEQHLMYCYVFHEVRTRLQRNFLQWISKVTTLQQFFFVALIYSLTYDVGLRSGQADMEILSFNTVSPLSSR